MTGEDFENFNKLIKDMDTTKFDMVDQMKLLIAYTEFVEKAKPIYLKYAVKEEGPKTFFINM